MAIDDNTSYELTGYQVKDLAQKIRAKADSSSLASVATSGLYSDLTGAPTIPTVYNGTLTIQQNGTTLGTFSANQSANETINITGGSSSTTTFYGTFNTAYHPESGIGSHLYSDSSLTTMVTSQDVYDAATSGTAIIEIYDANYPYTIAITSTRVWEEDSIGYEFGCECIATGYGDAPYIYILSASAASTTFSETHLKLQPKLTAGTGISINHTTNTISATGATVAPVVLTLDSPSAGQFRTDKTFDRLYSEDVVEVFVNTSRLSIIGYDESSYVIYVCDGTNVYSLEYTSGSATTGAYTTTPLTVFTGATSSVAGSAGLVPAPTTSDVDKYLKGDGTWATVQAGSTMTTFYWDGPNSAMYKDSTLSTAATISDVETAASAGPVRIFSARFGFYEYLVTDDMSVNGYFSTVYATSNGSINSVVYLYDLYTWSRTAVNLQKALTAGSNITIAGDGTISATDTTYSNFTGATSSVAGSAGLVPAPAAGDEAKALHGDGTWKDTTAKLVEMSYGEANAWTKFINAYNSGSIVYCRASSNANPGTGSQTRKAFMAYVNNAANPTNVEFQYVRSQSSKTDSQQTDQVFVYTLTNASGGTWSVASRNMGPKVVAGTGMSSTFTTGANATITLNAEPDYSTSEVDTKVKWIDGKTIYRKTINYGTLPDTTTQFVNHNISSLGNVIKIEGFMTEGTVWRTLPYADGAFNSVYVTTTQVGIYTTSDMTAWSAYVTLYYTKSS